MARLQILELPAEHHGDDMVTPFILVVDEHVPLRYVSGIDMEDRTVDEFAGVAEQIGARGVLVFREAVEIPAAAPLSVLKVADDAERAGTTQLVYAHERTRLDLCAALMLSGDTTWRQLVAVTAEQQQTLARILDLPEQPQAIVPGRPPMDDYLHGYGVGVRAAKHIARNEPARRAEDGG